MQTGPNIKVNGKGTKPMDKECLATLMALRMMVGGARVSERAKDK